MAGSRRERQPYRELEKLVDDFSRTLKLDLMYIVNYIKFS